MRVVGCNSLILQGDGRAVSDKGHYVEWLWTHGAHAAHDLERTVAAQAEAGGGGTPSRGTPMPGVQRCLRDNSGVGGVLGSEGVRGDFEGDGRGVNA